MKAPGTIDTKTNREVIYLPFYVNGAVPMHTIEGLCEYLGIDTADREITEDTPPRALPDLARRQKPDPRRYLQPVKGSKAYTWGRKADKAQRKPRKAHNAASPLIARYRELELLVTHRRGITEGMRWGTCLHYHGAIWGAYAVATKSEEDKAKAREQAWRQVQEFNRRYCKPPLDHGELLKLRRQTVKPRFRAHTICQGLGITREEAERLEFVHLLPKEVRREREQDKRESRERTKRHRYTKREAVTEAIKAGRSNAQIKRDLRQHFTDRENTADVYLHRLRTALGVDDPGSTKAHRRHLPLIKG